MKKESHIIIGVLSAYALNLPVFPAMVASVLPDVDIKLGLTHRGITHHALIIPFLLILSGLIESPFFTSFVIGYISHLVADAFTPRGIPVWKTQNRFSLNAFSTGSLTEYLFVAIFTICVLILKLIEVKKGSWIELLPADVFIVFGF